MNTEIIAPLNTTVWSIWQNSDPRTNNVFFADFNTTGISVTSRPYFSTRLTSSEAAAFSIASAVGDDYENWVDASYIV
jgi:pectinesterase